MATISKEEYLKRYLSGDAGGDKKKKKKKPKGVKQSKYGYYLVTLEMLYDFVFDLLK
jgi:hypothetical protein